MRLTTKRDLPALTFLAFAWTSSMLGCSPGAITRTAAPDSGAISDRHFPLSEAPTDEEFERTPLFDERLVPLGSTPTTPTESRALSSAIRAFIERADRFDTTELEAFLRDHPESPWRASLLTNLGVLWRETGRYGAALDAWQSAWTLTRADRTWKGYGTADRAVSELALLDAQLGRNAALADLFQQLRGRPAVGAAAERITRAQRGLATMRTQPEVAYRCGPFAVLNVRRALQPTAVPPVAPEEVTSTAEGTSLSQLVALSARVGEPMRAMRRDPGSGFVVPSVVHWRLNHYAALVGVETERSGERVYVVRDPTFGEDVRTTERWLDAETSGYVLVPARLAPPASWTPVEEAEAAAVWGRGATTGADPHNFGNRDLRPDS